ncbi:MAG TPA: SDR family NAD(P)-dependent oxidoreductase, partial [Mycobacteriales bacterium]|nr:SDR family NAD(P)-dependent oxidoreductase [Mycobacteriales bacterium]
ELANAADGADLAAGAGIPARVVHAFGLDGVPAADPDAVWRAQDDGFFSVLALAQALAAAQPPGPVRLDVLTAGTCDAVGGDLTRPEHATVAGPVKVLPLELPWLTVRQIDLDDRAAGGDIDAAVAELGRDVDHPVVALRAGRRWVGDFDRIPVPAGDDPAAGLPIDGVCLITGGLGGIGITVAEDMARRGVDRLALLSRTALPARDEWDTYLAVHGVRDRLGRAIAAVRRMERAGAQVLLSVGDVTRTGDLRRVRDEVFGRFGRLDVLVHAAGVPGGGMAEVKERAAAEAVLAPKVLGTSALAEVFGDVLLDTVVLCSSVTSVAGGFGQVDYCGANAFLDALARGRHGFSGRVVSLNWGGWLEVGMAAEVAAPDALRALQRGMVTAPMDHPVLSAVHHDPVSGLAWCTGLVGPDTHWVLGEHRINGVPVLPGTGQLETVRAAFAAAVPDGSGRAVELRDVAFTQPLAVPEGGRAEVRVNFAEGPEGWDFQVTSRADGRERTHVRGTAGWVTPDPAPVRDVAAVLARCTVGTVEPKRSTVGTVEPTGSTINAVEPKRSEVGSVGTGSHSGMLSFGPHWSSLRRVHVGVDEELGWFEVAEPWRAEAAGWVLHPALLDEATSFGTSQGGDSGGDSYLPIGYGRLLVRGPLPDRMWSHLRYRDGGNGEVLVADLSLLAEDGTEVVEIGEFVLRRVDPDAVRAGLLAGDDPGSTATAGSVGSDGPDALGIAPADGAEALRRMLATDLGPQVVVTVSDIDRVIAGVRAVTGEAVAGGLAGAGAESEPADHSADGDYAAPRTPLEATLCELWGDVLGADRIGVDDDFFDLGGNSLVAVQLIAQVRKSVGEKLPMRSLFEAPTVAGMAAAIERLRAEPAPTGR